MAEKVGTFFVVVLTTAAFVGWVMNLVAIAKADAVTPFVLLRVVGAVVAPIGAVLGYL